MRSFTENLCFDACSELLMQLEIRPKFIEHMFSVIVSSSAVYARFHIFVTDARQPHQ